MKESLVFIRLSKIWVDVGKWEKIGILEPIFRKQVDNSLLDVVLGFGTEICYLLQARAADVSILNSLLIHVKFTGHPEVAVKILLCSYSCTEC